MKVPMSEISDSTRRISAALDRIGAEIEAREASGEDSGAGSGGAEGDARELRKALLVEKQVNARLEERTKILRRRVETESEASRQEVAELRAEVEQLRIRLEATSDANLKMRGAIAKLREAAARGVAEPGLVNQAMLTELEELRAERDRDRDAIDEILGELKPMLANEAQDA